MNIHDSGYKKLFSNHTLFRDLLVHFVEEEEQQYRSQEEIHSMIVEAILKQEEQIRGEGKAEQQRLTAQCMSAKGYPLPVIAELLGLNEDEVRILLTSTDQTQ
jgi:hypothetical protein